MNPPITIVDTGIANSASVIAAFGRIGFSCILSDEARVIDAAEALVLPGVGSFGAGMDRLRALGVTELLRERIRGDRPTLAICLGMQLLGEGSEESPGVKGLGVLPVRAERFGGDVRTPQFGWNTVEPGTEFGLAEVGYAYFANSYRLTEAPEGWSPAWTDHGGRFVSALRRGNTLACQFHPELSGGAGQWGLGLLRAWTGLCIQSCEEGASCSQAE